MTFLLSEDKALRQRLEGMIVHDQQADGTDVPRPVRVFYGLPDQELRQQSYPYIVIDMVDIQKDGTREMRGTTDAAYLIPRDAPIVDNSEFVTDLPIPVNIDYQVSTFARHPRHDRELVSQLLHVNLPFRFGYLLLDDGTIRRMDVLDVAKRDDVEQGKRLFTNTVTVRVSSEIASVAFKTLYTVQDVIVHPTQPLSSAQVQAVNNNTSSL